MAGRCGQAPHWRDPHASVMDSGRRDPVNNSKDSSEARAERASLHARKQEYLLLWDDKTGSNTVESEQRNRMLEGQETQSWGIWAHAAKKVHIYWQTEASNQMPKFPQASQDLARQPR
jgi:hypothetical protein